MKKFGKRLFENTPPLSSAIHPLYGSGAGFCPDIMSQTGYAVFPELSATELEIQTPSLGATDNTPNILPPYGKEGMMPCSMIGYGEATQPGSNVGDEGTGGCGSFMTTPAYGAKG